MKRKPTKEQLTRAALGIALGEAVLIALMSTDGARLAYEFYLSAIVLVSLFGIWKYARMKPADIEPPLVAYWVDVLLVMLRTVAVVVSWRAGRMADVGLVIGATVLQYVQAAFWLYRYRRASN